MFKYFKYFDKWYWHLIYMLLWGTVIGPQLAISHNIFLILLDFLLFVLLFVWTIVIMKRKE